MSGVSGAGPTAFLGVDSRFALTAMLAAGGLIFKTGLRLLAPSASESIASDRRDPILLLRSFSDDSKKLDKGEGGPAILASYFTFSKWSGDTFEEAITTPLKELGPVIALARPGEKLSPLGAARVEVSNERWQIEVQQWIETARVVVMILGDTAGLGWEIRQLVETGNLAKAVIVIPALSPELLAARWSATRRAASTEPSVSNLPESIPDSAVAIVFSPRGQCEVLTNERRTSATYRDIFARRYGSIVVEAEREGTLLKRYLWGIGGVMLFALLLRMCGGL